MAIQSATLSKASLVLAILGAIIGAIGAIYYTSSWGSMALAVGIILLAASILISLYHKFRKEPQEDAASEMAVKTIEETTSSPSDPTQPAQPEQPESSDAIQTKNN